MKIRDFIFEIQVIIMTLILAFAEFAPVGDNFSLIGYFTAFAIGALNLLAIILAEIKNGKLITGSQVTFIVSTILLLQGYYSKSIIILASIMVVKSQFNMLKKRWDEIKSNYQKILPKKSVVFKNGVETELGIEEIEKGNVVLVKSGEIIPTDGLVFTGNATLDEKNLFMESEKEKQRKVTNGDFVFGGSINTGDSIQVEAVASAKGSVIGKIIEKINSWDIEKSKTFQFCKKIVLGIQYLSIILGIALISFWIFGVGYEYKSSIYWGSFLLLISNVDIVLDLVKISMEKFMIEEVRVGIILNSIDVAQNSQFIDRILVEENSSFFRGAYQIVKIHSEGIVTKEEMLVYAAHIELESDHPIGRAIYKGFMQLAKYENISPEDAIRRDLVGKVEIIKEKGITGKFRSKFICLGNEDLMALVNIKNLPKGNNVKLIHMAINGKYAGYIALRYIEKDGIGEIYKAWKEAGIKKYADLSGRYEDLIRDINEDKNKINKTGLVTFENEQLVESILENNGVDLWFSLGGLKKKYLLEKADALFLDNDLTRIGRFIISCRKFFNNLKKGIGLVILLKVLVYAVGYMFIPSVSTTFMIDAMISIIAIYKIT